MDKETAITEAQHLTGKEIAGQLDTKDWEGAAERAVTFDEDRRRPGHPEWVPSFDPYWLAAEAVTRLATRTIGSGGQLEGFRSEGSSFQFSTGNLWAMADALRAQSPLSKLSGGLGSIQIDGSLSDYQNAAGTTRPGGVAMLTGGQLVPKSLDWE